jgi:hypothetical protein
MQDYELVWIYDTVPTSSNNVYNLLSAEDAN